MGKYDCGQQCHGQRAHADLCVDNGVIADFGDEPRQSYKTSLHVITGKSIPNHPSLTLNSRKSTINYGGLSTTESNIRNTTLEATTPSTVNIN